MSNVPAIEVQNITVIYNEGTPNEVVALDNISLTVEQGETIIITGGNGSGKSTLLKAIAGAVTVKSGRIIMNGKNVTKWASNHRAEEIGFVHQDPMLGTCPNLTVHENFQLSTDKPWWLPFPYRLAMSNEQMKAIDKTGLPLGEKTTTPVSMLSGGQRQAIALCLAFSSNHSILLFDEFTSALDEKTEEAVLSFAFQEAKRLNAAVLMVMHDLEKANSLGHRIESMSLGKFSVSSN